MLIWAIVLGGTVPHSRADVDRVLTDGEFLAHAYREAARRHHPDVGGDVDVFKEVQECTRIVSAA